MRTATTPAVRTILAAVLVTVSGALAGSCGRGASPPAPTAPSRDFSADAKKSIDEKNVDSELEKLKREVDDDSK
jgi:hypothetical protein